MNMQTDILRSSMLACEQRVARLNLVISESQLVIETFESISAYLERKGFSL